ncbi:MAG: OmpA family protein [Chitinophagales bacterium]|nr:OmpA family protein [Chitinophagales bacterium]
MKNLIYLFISFFIISEATNAQQYTTVKNASKKTLHAYDDAQKMIMSENYAGAIQQLDLLTKTDENFIDGWLLLGELYKEEGNYQQAKTTLERVTALDINYSSKCYFFLAESNWNLDNYEECISASKQYLTFTDISKSRELLAKQYIANAEFAVVAIAHPVPFNPETLGDAINTDAPEYLPSLTGDEKTIIFTRRPGNGRSSNEDFFESHMVSEQWSHATPLTEINTAYNEGAQSITPDGNIIYFVVCDKPNGYGSCDIYFTQKRGDEWSVPENVGAPVCSNAWETQPSIAADGKTLYFVSTRQGGKGGSDIWYSVKDKNGRWSVPQNAGDSVNTSFDEKTPFIHPDGKTLYFSSSGHPGMGKDDIFFSRKNDDGRWGMPVNLGYPINTKNAENSFIVSLDGKHAYFASDRFKTGRDMDLYFFNLYNAARPNPVTYLTGNVTDSETGSAVAADLQLIELKSGEITGEATSDSQTGNYLVSVPTGANYALNVSAKGYLFFSENLPLKDYISEEPFRFNVPLQPIQKGGTVVLKNIFFESDSYVLKEESKVELSKLNDLMKQNPTLKIQISGHTDNNGSAAYNQSLSENRARTVYEYLISSGIAATRLSYKGYGETKPVRGNETESGRSENRRTEFTVTGY